MPAQGSSISGASALLIMGPDAGAHDGGLPMPIILSHMPQQMNIRKLSDDWTGQSNQLERKRRQNRLNQREHRKRKEAQLQGKVYQVVDNTTRASNVALTTTCVRQRHTYQNTGLWQLFCSAISDTQPQISKLAQVAVALKVDEEKSDIIIRQFQRWVTRNHMVGSPTTDHVLVLIKFNVFRAVVANAGLLDIRVELAMEEDSLSPFAPESTLEISSRKQPILHLPEALRPTPIQCRIRHHPWIDLLPIPRMRDNLILAGDSYDESDLCEDLCGFYNRPATRSGLIIWGSPWDPAGWELTPYFLGKWTWILIGCTELMLATNHWRQKRGEKPVNFATLGLRP